MKKLFKIGMVMLLALALAGCGGDKDTDSSSENSTTDDLLSGNHHAEIDVKDYGVIKVELNADEAPITVTNFVKLAKEGFYDGLTFHRIIDGFMIQGGDPNGDGTGGSDETIKGEFSANNVDNILKHTRGAISMARSQDYDSASSQFFIVHQTYPSLDGQYAVFGYVYEGMDVVDQIATSVPVTDDNSTVEAQNQPVITSIKIID
ncbi:peptidylprolyl isomerase [[Clostridium] saccharogumia]|uniref:peptidylprolyl isomerase n=1 Tax=Thomasclavelia saccharogumia TaxID=341225 RepID=UPI001D08D5AB|nr:peptidylprolyl isomerase [Thomasclavelia saccharogumia]MCB6706981.1 peptidylprolyl isomerase [Thomasclavelia saccharogumia]